MTMSSSFFLKKQSKGGTKRKFPSGQHGGGKGRNKRNTTFAAPTKKRPQKDDEEIASDDDELESDSNAPPGASNLMFSSDEGEEETAQDKRLRLAKLYLEEIEKQETERAEELKVHDHVAHRLQTEYLDSVGRLRRNIAGAIEGYDTENVIALKNKKQHLTVCTLALSPDNKWLFTGAKTNWVLKWDLETCKLHASLNAQLHAENPDNGIKRRSHVIAMCLSSDMKFLALSEGGNNIQIWCPQTLKHLQTFKGHRDVVTALVCRKDTHELYSASRDRSVKIWSLDEMAYVESLFGHQTGITGIDALSRERAVTSGGSDCTLRIWKITEESQLIYNGHHGSIENVKFINDENFISAGDDGSICVWSALKKKPLCTKAQVHGAQANGDANWITALSCVVNTDLIATGSSDGFIRLWQSAENGRKLTEILTIPMAGFINSLTFNSDGSKLYAGVGQEHRLGRWWRVKEAKNKIVILNLKRTPETAS